MFVWFILGLGLLALGLFIERALFLHRVNIRVKDFASGITNLITIGRIPEALAVCEETPGPMGSVIKSALLSHDLTEAERRAAVQSAALVHIPLLERRIGLLTAIASIAPVLGILGTFAAMHEGIAMLLDRGTQAGVTDLLTGMQQAMTCSILGLMVCVPSLLAYYYLSDRVHAMVEDMEWAAHTVLNALANRKTNNDAVPQEKA